MTLAERKEKQGTVEIEETPVFEFGYTNEYSKLESVLLHIPRRNEIMGKSPIRAMWKSVPNYEKLLEEVDQYRDLLKKLKIKVYDDIDFKDTDLYPFPNQLFSRDLAVITPDGVILANPFWNVRKGEQDNLIMTMRRNGFIGRIIDLPKDVTMEGADFFWINDHEVIISVGNRTGTKFVGVFEQMYPDVHVTTVEAQAEGIPQHMLGCKHVVNDGVIVSRNEVNPDSLGFASTIELEETKEVVEGYAMNIVTIGPNEIIMPEGCPDTQAIYEGFGITCHTTPCYEMGKMGGAIACMTLPIKRRT